jgi:predicted nucleotidyltransferase
MQNLKELLERLLKNNLDFVLIGGFASVTHGSTLLTQDLDICAAMTEDNMVRLKEALVDIHPRHRMNPSFKPSFFDQPKDFTSVNNIYLETDLGVLDVLSSVPPAGSFEEIKLRALNIKIYGYNCKVISLEDLIYVKSDMKRPKDIATLEELKIIQAELLKKTASQKPMKKE